MTGNVTLDPTRRRVLATTGTALLTSVAGCSGGGGGSDSGDGGETLPGETYPALHEWLTEESEGGADRTYDETVVDRRDTDAVTIDVGAEGNGGNFAFAPSAVVISADTEVRWEWTGQGEAHNVNAAPKEQLGKSDFTFTSGDAVSGTGTKFSRTFEETGIALYHCVPHLSLGMKGGIAIE